METAKIGATPKGGIKRLTLTDLDRQVRDWFRAACEAAGCTVTIDDMGNMFARRAGREQYAAADRHGQPSRHAADRREVRRRHRRAVRPGGAAHAERSADRDQRADRGHQLDQRGRQPLRAGHAGLRRVRGRVRSRATPTAATDREGKTFGEELDRIGYRGNEKSGAPQARARISRCISSRGRSWRPRARPSASSPACRACAGSR